MHRKSEVEFYELMTFNTALLKEQTLFKIIQY